MPPDVADEIRDSQFAFEKAMGKLTKATNGIRRDLPVEIDSTAVPKAQAAWEGKQKLIVHNGHRPPFDLGIEF